jgi:hypothetical protein
MHLNLIRNSKTQYVSEVATVDLFAWFDFQLDLPALLTSDFRNFLQFLQPNIKMVILCNL